MLCAPVLAFTVQYTYLYTLYVHNTIDGMHLIAWGFRTSFEQAGGVEVGYVFGPLRNTLKRLILPGFRDAAEKVRLEHYIAAHL